MVKPLVFKGDKKPKKRKHAAVGEDGGALPRPGQIPSAGDATGGRTESAGGEPAGDDTWVTADAPSDLSGPVVVVLPTEPATCLACDAGGKVFASELENLVEGDPGTAEPHDVRQVWVANQVAGTDSVSLKGHHGKYLAADKFGILSANRDAISAEELFICIPAPNASRGMLALQTARGTFLGCGRTAESPEARADADAVAFAETLRVRMQARFKPRLQADKATRAREKISRKELEAAVGRRLDEEEVRRLKRARRDGDYHEALLDVKVRGKHDKFA